MEKNNLGSEIWFPVLLLSLWEPVAHSARLPLHFSPSSCCSFRFLGSPIPLFQVVSSFENNYPLPPPLPFSLHLFISLALISYRRWWWWWSTKVKLVWDFHHFLFLSSKFRRLIEGPLISAGISESSFQGTRPRGTPTFSRPASAST